MARRVAARASGLTEGRFTVGILCVGTANRRGSSYGEGGGGDKRRGTSDDRRLIQWPAVSVVTSPYWVLKAAVSDSSAEERHDSPNRRDSLGGLPDLDSVF